MENALLAFAQWDPIKPHKKYSNGALETPQLPRLASNTYLLRTNFIP